MSIRNRVAGLIGRHFTEEAQLPPLIWFLIGAGAFMALLRFGVLPFLTIYLTRTTGLSSFWVGVIVGLGPVAAMLFSISGGRWTDRVGRRAGIAVGAAIDALAMVGFALVHLPLWFALVSFLSGIAWAVQGPAVQALLTDLTPPRLRTRIFGYDYWAINLGAAVGPLVGVQLGAGSTASPFLLLGAASAGMCLLALRLVPRGSVVHANMRGDASADTAVASDGANAGGAQVPGGAAAAADGANADGAAAPGGAAAAADGAQAPGGAAADGAQANDNVAASAPSFRQTLGILARDPLLLLFMSGAIFVGLEYSQIETNVGRHLGLGMAGGAALFAHVLSINALTVIVLQPFLGRLAERRGPFAGVAVGACLEGAGALAMLLAGRSQLAWIGAMVVFTLGEILMAPAERSVVAELAPEHLRGTYFSAMNLGGSLAFAIGPALGGLVLAALASPGLFGGMAISAGLAAVAFVATGRLRARREVRARHEEQARHASRGGNGRDVADRSAAP